MSFPLRQSRFLPDFPQHVEIVLGTFARRHDGVFIVSFPGAALPPGACRTLDVYCIFADDVLPQAMAAARNAFAGTTDMEIRCHSCAEYDGTFLNRASRGARVFGERRYASR